MSVALVACGLLAAWFLTRFEPCRHRCACPLDLLADDHRRSCPRNLYHAPWHPRGEQ